YCEAVDQLPTPSCISGRVAAYVQVNPLPQPVVPSPVSTSCGTPATLTASGSTGIFRWFKSPTGGNPLEITASFTTLPIIQPVDTYYVEAINTATTSISQAYTTPGNYTFTVPPGVTEIYV